MSFPHIGWVYEAFLSCGVVFGLVITLLLEDTKTKVDVKWVKKCKQTLPVASLKPDSTGLVSTIVRMSPFLYASSPGFGFMWSPLVIHWVPAAQVICRSRGTIMTARHRPSNTCMLYIMGSEFKVKEQTDTSDCYIANNVSCFVSF